MFELAWEYRWGCLQLLFLQSLLLVTALVGLQFGGIGIDVLRYHLGDRIELPQLPGGMPLPATTPLIQVLLLAIATLVVALLRAWLNYWYAIASGKLVHERIVVDLRARVYDKLQRLSFRFFDQHASGSLINRVTGDVHAVRSFVDTVLVQVVILILSIGCYLTYMIRIDLGLTLACLATTPVMWLITAIFSRRIRPQYDRHRDLVDRLILVLTENLNGVHVVKGFGRERQEIEKFDRANDEVRDQQGSVFLRVSIYTPVIQLLSQLNLVILLIYGGYLVVNDRISLGTGLVVFAGLLQQLSSQVSNLAGIANTIQQSLSGARRVFEILDTPIEICSRPDPIRSARLRGEITFSDVSFAYLPDKPVLQNISLAIPAGSRVAILGGTGAGKSTLLSLVARFYDANTGSITIDGIDVRDLHLDDLRRNIGIVFQESFLFSNTIAANIAFGHPDASQAQIEKAAAIASATEFIDQLPQRYETVLGEFGLNLSGGQRQRLAIARALLLDPPILLLDDPAAAVDASTEHEILTALRTAMRDRTTLLIAHRLSTLESADFVVVLENGRITQMGTHQELLQRDGHYLDVAISQGWISTSPDTARAIDPVKKTWGASA